MNDPEMPVSDYAHDALREIRNHVSQDSPSSFKSRERPDATGQGGGGGKGKGSGDDTSHQDFLTELEEDDEDEDVGFVQPKRSWFLSTAFPLIAGTFGPLASLFSICAIVEGWRVRLPDVPGVNGLESEGRPIKDPPWSIVLNVVSLVSALVGNLVLLFNFAQRIRYSIAQPVTILLWYFSGFILIALLAVAPHLESQNAQTPHHRFSQSYYSGIISAALYLLLATLLLINFFTSSPMPYFSHPHTQDPKHTDGKDNIGDEGEENPTNASPHRSNAKSILRIRKVYTHPPSFAPLTIPQRTLMLQSTFLTIYLGLGALIFHYLQSHTISPLTPSSQLSSASGPSFNETLSFPAALYFVDYTILTIGLGSDFPLQTAAGRGVLVPYALGGVLMVGMVVGSVRGLVVERAKVKGWRRGVWKERMRVVSQDSGDGEDREDKKGLRRRRGNSKLKRRNLREGFDAEAFEAMRAIERRVAKKQNRQNTINATLAFLLVWFMGALVFYFTEKPQQWTYATSLYFTYVSLLTIGYGDFVPQSNSGRPFFVLWSLVAVPTVTVFISVAGAALVSGLKVSSVWIAQRTILPERPGGGGVHDSSNGSSGDSEGSRDVEKNKNKTGLRQRSSSTHTGASTSSGSDKDKDDASLDLRLIREISRLLDHLGKNGGGTRHEWQEWDGWLGLLSLKSVKQDAEREGVDDAEVGFEVGGDGRGRDGGEGRVRRRGGGAGSKDDGRRGGDGRGKGGKDEMGWLHEDGPLFSDVSETEWVLARLCERLEGRLKERDKLKDR